MERGLIAGLASVLIALPALHVSASSGEAVPEASFRIHVLRCRWPTDVHGYTIRELRPQLAKCPLEDALFVVETADIGSYCWDRHALELTREGTDRLVAALGEDWVRFGGSNHVFVATLGEKRLYEGVFYDEYGAAAIGFPVVHVDRLEGRLSFRVRDGLVYKGDGTRRIGLAAVRDFFHGVGKLRCD